MPIDATVPLSDGWWAWRCWTQLRDQQKRLDVLQKRYEGDPPLPQIHANARAAVQWFIRQSVTNLERLIVEAVLSRLSVIGIRTGADSDEGGDANAYKLWTAARMQLVLTDAIKLALVQSQGIVAVGQDSKGALLVTAEDPRQTTLITDPADPYRVLAGFKLLHDDVNDLDLAYLYMPGRVRVGVAKRKARTATITFSLAAYDWDDGRGGEIPQLITSRDAETQEITDGLVPLVPLVNEDGKGEFEPHIPLIDRIAQQILHRLTIAAIQAFKQRAFKGLPQVDPLTGLAIDYDEIFIADPGAIWNIPANIEIWESGQVDLQPILLAVRDDVQTLAAVSGTPLYTITPDAAQGSAEGASLQRETNTFKVLARQSRFTPAIKQIAQLMFLMRAGEDDDKRAELGSLEVIWAPVERYSMSEKANAMAQTAGRIPRYQQLTQIWGMTPAEADRAMVQLTSDLVLEQQYAAAKVAGNANAG